MSTDTGRARGVGTTISPTDVNQLAMVTRDIKCQIAYFTDVQGYPLRVLYRMQGVEGARHAFVELNLASDVAFVGRS